MADSEEKTGNFTVTDRRAFDPHGAPKSDQPVAPPEKPAEAPRPAQEPPATRPAQESLRALPPADFATLVLSLGSSAVMYLGQSDEPDGKKPARNFPMAKHAIDLLTVLEEKTKGNLSAEEEQILESLLFDLRLRYVEALKTAPSGAASGGA
jgi:Domain of unknown function (DUF1844)